MKKIAVILFNLGGPDNLEAVQPFLFNLFNDKAIIKLPQPLRWCLAKFISKQRAPIAKDIYAYIGGKSPILDNTLEQQKALDSFLKENGSGEKFKVFTVMRYWKPFSKEVVEEVKSFAPDEIILLPLYPQLSTSTSVSSIEDWQVFAAKCGLHAPTKTICCYPKEPKFIQAHCEKIRSYYEQAKKVGRPRILFSAHGLPKKIINAGDPYQWQVEQTSKAVVEALAIENLDWGICYQSRVGPLEWIGPSTEAEIERAAEDNVPVVLVPIAFVSEHSETLVELDIEYKGLAEEQGVPGYFRVPTLDADESFIASLGGLCLSALKENKACCSPEELCPNQFSQCYAQRSAA